MKNQLLSEKELSNLSIELPLWSMNESKITRTFNFDNFIEAFGFMTKVAMISESSGHHPEWSNTYSCVKIQLTTHDLGGLSHFDINLARKIDKIADFL